ncbi:energy-coupling factor transporter transmembrane protein EcfT [Neobacillus notoginsengisoli]|uniref:Energy-coupling factor transporter transmembrane protein EcfT n=1 Tax=Neobacillus notoginsengisoli TaxID=1578198 RepID=A0A417YIR1_9BACI|nr:energy-coupling factor transporter transmembrane component T [Neobacillus notoginsengisoli]RHW32824.1 energy-coupling factor transporter transmembrane protein EcfT [Neobacillus notoginsengisoli]
MLKINEKDTFISRLYPMTKIWFAIGLTIGIFAFSNYYVSAVIFIMAFAIIVKDGMLKEFRVLIIAAIILGISLFMIQGILNPTNQTVIWNVIPGTNFTFYKEGLIIASNVYSRILPLVAALFLLVRTLNITELGVALNKLGVSHRASFVLTSTFQIITVLKREMQHIIDAQKTRGLETEGNLFNRIKAFIPIMVPLISNSIMKVQSQVIALESKGFNFNIKKSYYRDPEKTNFDTVMVVGAILFAVSGVTYRLLVI